LLYHGSNGYANAPQYYVMRTMTVSFANEMACVYCAVRTEYYTECPRRNVPDFGRVFLMLKYTDI